MKASKRTVRSAALLLVLILLLGFTAYGATTQELIEQTQEEQQEEMNLLASTEELIAALEAKKGDSEAYLTELNNQLTSLADNLAYLEEQHQIKADELAAVEEELAEAEEKAESQYEDMKLRIKYFYESSIASSTLNSIFSAEDFMDFLTRIENYDQLNKYDRELLTQYEETILSIEEMKQEIISENEAIEALSTLLDEQRLQTELVYADAYNEMLEYIEDIEEARGSATALTQSIREKEEEINALLIRAYEEQVAAEEAARKEAEERAAAEAAAAAQKAAEEAAAAQAAAEAASSASASSSSASNAAAADTSAQTSSGSSAVVDDTVYEAVSMTYLGNFTITAYCPCEKCCGKWATGYTASGAKAVEGVTVAMGGVDFGTQLYINGHIYTVQDRGTAYGHVDIFFDSHEACIAFGLKYWDVYLVN